MKCVIYKAIGDFSSLIKDAAAARAEMTALSKATQAQGQAEADAASKSALARDKDAQAMLNQKRAYDQLAASAKQANMQTLYGGRPDMGQHLSDLAQEQRWQDLLLRARNLGFTSPQAAYSWRQMELQQHYLMNRAKFGATSSGTGFTTPNEYLAYLQKEYTARQQENTVLLARAAAYRANADAALAYGNALKGRSDTFGTLGTASSMQLAGIQQFNAALVGLPDQVTTQLDIDDSAALSKLALYQSILRGVPQRVTTTDVLTAAYGMGGVPIPSALQGETIPVSIGGPYESQLNSLMADIAQLSRDRVEIPVHFNLPDKEQLAGMVTGLPHAGPTLQLGGGGAAGGGGGGGPPPVAPGAPGPSGPDPNIASLWNQAAQAMANAGNAASKADGPVDQLSKTAYRGYGWWGLLTRQLTLFGGLLGTGALIGHVAVWHVVLDGIIEALAVLVPALVTAALGLTAFAAAAEPAAKSIAERMFAIYQVSQATNTVIPPMTNNFKKFQDAVKPQVVQLFGDALTILNSNTGIFGRLAEQTGAVLDKLAARFVVFATSGGQGFQKFLETGAKDLALFGNLLQSLFTIFAHLIKATELTHIAEILLSVIDVFAHLVAVITSIPAPALAALLALHGFIIWGGLATTVLLKVLGPISALSTALGGLGSKISGNEVAGGAEKADSAFSKLKATVKDIGTGFLNFGSALGGLPGKLGAIGGAADQVGAKAKIAAFTTGLWRGALAGLTAVPVWGWALAGVAVLGILLVAFGRGKDAADQWIDSTNKAIASATNWNAIPVTLNAVVTAQGKVADASAAVNKAWQENNTQAGYLKARYGDVSGALTATGRDLDNLQAAGDRYNTQLHAQLGFLDQVSKKTGFDYPQAVALAQIAGVKLAGITDQNSKAFKIALQQVQGLVDGYRAMGQQGGALGNDVNAVNLAMELQDTQVSKLNTAWDTFIGLVTGGEAAFQKFGTDLNTLTTAAKQSGASFDGLNKNSIALQQGFTGAIVDGSKLLDQFRQQAVVMDDTGRAQQLLTRGGKDLIATLIPMASHSKAAQDQLYALAQNAGYTGVNSLKALTKWTGEQGATGAERDLLKVTGTLTTAVSDLATDYQNLANVLSTDVNQMMADSILKAGNAQTAFLNFAQGIEQGTTSTKKFHDAASDVIKVLLQQYSGDLPKAKAAFEAYAIQLGDTKGEADQLWDTLHGKVSVELANQHAVTVPKAKDAFVTFAKEALHLGTQKADELWTELTTKLGPQLDGLANKHVPGAEKAFTDWATGALNLTKSQAHALWDELNTLQGRIDSMHGTTVKIIAEASGTGQIAITGTGWALGQGNIRFHSAGGGMVPGMAYAGGGQAMAGRIPGYNPGVDSYDAKVSPGEFILTPEAAAAVGYDKLDSWNKMYAWGRQGQTGWGYASGGFVSLEGQLAGLQPAAGQDEGADSAEAVHTGIETALAAIKKSVTKFAAGSVSNYHAGAGVQQWRGAVQTALKMAGADVAQLTDPVLYQMQTESGGNPTIVNKWDSNWLAGHPSVGLMQVIAGTYATYGAPREGYPPPVAYGVSEAPVANIYAAIRYAQANYGPGLRNQYGGIGTGHGYAAGGPVGGYAGMDPYPAGTSVGVSPTGYASGGSAGPPPPWRFPVPTGLHSYDVTDKGFRLGWNAVKGPHGQKPSGYTIETRQLNDKLVDKFIAHATSTAQYGPGGHGLHPGWQYRTMVWANGGSEAPPHANLLTTLKKSPTVAGLPSISTTAQDAYQAWFANYAALDRDVHAELAALWALSPLTGVGRKGGPTKAQAVTWKEQLAMLQALQKRAIGLGVKPPGAYAKIAALVPDHPEQITQAMWANFISDVSNLEGRQSAFRLGWQFEPVRSKALHAQLERLLSDAHVLDTAWQGTFGPGAQYGATPGAPRAPRATPVGGGLENITSLIIGGPATPVFGGMGSPDMGFSGGGTIHPFMQGFAGGGPVGLQQVAGMFSGIMPTAMLMPTAMPGGIPDTMLRRLGASSSASDEVPRRLSQAGAAHKAAFNVETLNINNPVAEQPSLSIARAANRLAFLAGRGES